jgi:hypothetical protein
MLEPTQGPFHVPLGLAQTLAAIRTSGYKRKKEITQEI